MYDCPAFSGLSTTMRLLSFVTIISQGKLECLSVISEMRIESVAYRTGSLILMTSASFSISSRNRLSEEVVKLATQGPSLTGMGFSLFASVFSKAISNSLMLPVCAMISLWGMPVMKVLSALVFITSLINVQSDFTRMLSLNLVRWG